MRQRAPSAVWNSAKTAVFLALGAPALFGAVQSAKAQTAGPASPSEVERRLGILTGENDLAFEAVIDPCLTLTGRRVCPGPDIEPDAAGQSEDASPAGESRTEQGVTWVPGVRGELTADLALEDRVRERLETGAYAEAADDARRLLSLAEAGGGAPLRRSLKLLGDALYFDGRLAEAEAQYRRALTLELGRAAGLAFQFGEDEAVSLGRLANIYAAQGNIQQALKLSFRSVRIVFGYSDPTAAEVFYTYARISQQAQRLDQANEFFRRGAELFLTFYGEGSHDAAYGFNALGRLAEQRRDWPEALALLRRAAAIEKRGLDLGRSPDNAEPDRRGAYVFLDLANAAYELAERDPPQRDALMREAFEAAQWASQKSTAAALSQMAARQAKGAGPLAELLRRQQDLVAQWRKNKQALADALLASERPKEQSKEQSKSVDDIAALRRRLVEDESEIRKTDAFVAEGFPDYFALIKPAPLSLDDAQRLLAEDEALVLYAFTQDSLFVWAVSRDGAVWRKAGLSVTDATAQVEALRCGLDASAWSSAEGRPSRCPGLTGRAYSAADAHAGRPLPFDLARAHALHRALLAPVSEAVKGKRLLIAPSGPLTALPFHVLITAAAKDAFPHSSSGYADAAWLARETAITVMPSPMSLRSLRKLALASQGPEPYVGFGDPLVLGAGGADRSAWERTSCAAPRHGRRWASLALPDAIAKYFRGGMANVEALRRAPPLPETTDELCAVARSLSASESAVHLGPRATEHALKALSASGDLAHARIVHFATHGLLAGETRSLGAAKAEPALLLTPPDAASEDDDGLLTASEAAALKLDADWVILSACNTAAGEGPGAEALSGLSRAFFYAGARALLVSHWPVDSDAAVAVTTGVFAELKAHPGIGRAEALNRVMLSLSGKGGAMAHPAYWAPFVLVGEGRR